MNSVATRLRRYYVAGVFEGLFSVYWVVFYNSTFGHKVLGFFFWKCYFGTGGLVSVLIAGSGYLV